MKRTLFFLCSCGPSPKHPVSPVGAEQLAALLAGPWPSLGGSLGRGGDVRALMHLIRRLTHT